MVAFVNFVYILDLGRKPLFWTIELRMRLSKKKIKFYFIFICRMILHRFKTRFLFMLWFYVTIASGSSANWQPCPELSTALRYPCRCKVEPFGPKSQLGAVSMDCDHVVFQTESPILPNSAPVISFSQRHCGQQVLPTQVRQELSSKFGIIFSFCNWLVFFVRVFFSISQSGICNDTITATKLRFFPQFNTTSARQSVFWC